MTAIRERCPTCDRAECEAATGPGGEVLTAARGVLNEWGQATEWERSVLTSYAEQSNKAKNDCRAHAVDWRTRCLSAESLLAEALDLGEEAGTRPDADGCTYPRWCAIRERLRVIRGEVGKRT